MIQQARRFLVRHEPKGRLAHHLKSGSGAIVGVGIVGGLASATGLPLLIAPFGATAVLLFGVPSSPLAQPANVIGGYLVAAAIAIGVLGIAPGWPLAAALAVGLSIFAMLALRVTHPPAGAIPLVAFAGGMPSATLFSVIAVGSLALVAYAALHHRLPPVHEYPRAPADEARPG